MGKALNGSLHNRIPKGCIKKIVACINGFRQDGGWLGREGLFGDGRRVRGYG
jgi:hypothetical protein